MNAAGGSGRRTSSGGGIFLLGSKAKEEMKEIASREVREVLAQELANWQASFLALLQAQAGSQSGTSQQSGGQAAGGQSAGGQPQGGTSLQAVMAAQALAQARLEVSQELKANLDQLKQVIRQSENTINKIEALMGDGGNSQTSQ